jgi:CRISPR-associated protein Cas2
MHVLITYDVATSSEGGQKRLRRVAKICLDYGQRVQFSVFECQVDPGRYVELKNRLEKAIQTDKDSLRFYNLGSTWNQRVEHVGVKSSFDPSSPLIV